MIALDDQRKALQTSNDNALAERNRLSGEIGQLFKTGKREAAEGLRNQVAALKEESANIEQKQKSTIQELNTLLYQIPNIAHESVPSGSTDNDNEVYKEWSETLPDLGETALPHWELAKKYDLFDLELGVKITGAGFPLYRGKGARLQRALINFFLDEAIAAGYEEIIPPLLVNEASATATGQLPDKDGQMYHATVDDLLPHPYW